VGILQGLRQEKSYPLWSKIEPGQFLGYEERTLRIGFPEGISSSSISMKRAKGTPDGDRQGILPRRCQRENRDAEDRQSGTGNEETENTAAQNNRAGDIRREALKPSHSAEGHGCLRWCGSS